MNPADSPLPPREHYSEGLTDAARIIPVIEETLHVAKELVESGQVVIRKTVHNTEQLVQLPLMQQGYHIERVAVGTFVDTPPASRQEGDTMIYPVLEEVVVVEKRLRLVEEIRVTRQETTRQHEQSVTLRREEVTTERRGPQPERPA